MRRAVFIIIDYIHRQTANIPNALHTDIHEGYGGGKWNRDWKQWYKDNPDFTKSDLEKQTKEMMKKYNIPKSSRNGAKRYNNGGC